jgi:hypothetical protein
LGLAVVLGLSTFVVIGLAQAPDAGRSSAAPRAVARGQIAFAAGDPPGVQFGIAVMNLDGSGRHLLTGARDGFQPAWTPDGRALAFSGFGADKGI